jgi:hypothetical protein
MIGAGIIRFSQIENVFFDAIKSTTRGFWMTVRFACAPRADVFLTSESLHVRVAG